MLPLLLWSLVSCCSFSSNWEKEQGREIEIERERESERRMKHKSKCRRVAHARRTGVIASCSELLSLHCLRCLCFCVLCFQPVPVRGSLSARTSQPPPRHPCAGLRLARGSSSVQFARHMRVYGHFQPTLPPTRE